MAVQIILQKVCACVHVCVRVCVHVRVYGMESEGQIAPRGKRGVWGEAHTTATRAAYTCVKVGEAACAFMQARANRPRPRTRFSSKSSSTIIWMLLTLTLLMCPFSDFFSAFHAMR